MSRGSVLRAFVVSSPMTIACVSTLGQTPPPPSVGASSIVGVVNSSVNPFIVGLNSASSDVGALSVASTNTNFTGLDRTGATRTMNFQGETRSSATFGQLHVYTTGTVSNAFYNAANPTFDNFTDPAHPVGVPDQLVSLGFATFDDTLQFGGQLQAGYRARYLFHVDGTNSGDGYLADLAVTIAGHDEAFFVGDGGFTSTVFATQDYEINEITPQSIHVQFSDQFVGATQQFADGATIAGTSDFSSTATLQAVIVVDRNGNPVPGITVTGASGTTYPNTVPEPGAAALLGAMGVALGRRRR